jgi:hypothetical protein
MVQLKYFGDFRDYFKYDLITALLKENIFKNYVFVPMLTKHREDNEGKMKVIVRNGKSYELLSFIHGCRNKSLSNWKTWLEPLVVKYHTVDPVDQTFFNDDTRIQYWKYYTASKSKYRSLS